MVTVKRNNFNSFEVGALRFFAGIALARKSFWYYLKAVDEEYYKENRWHLKKLANLLQGVYEGTILKEDGAPYRKLMINVPPQHGKTRTLVHFCNWVYGQNQSERIITASYNDDTAGDFSRYTRDNIQKEKFDPEDVVFSDIFPWVQIKRGQSSYAKWALEGEHFSYMGVGVGGSVTSKGGTLKIIDDLIKNAEEARNKKHLEKLWSFYVNTFLSRVSSEEGKDPIEIIVMTRWSQFDTCGMILRDKFEKEEWIVYTLEVYPYEKYDALPVVDGEKNFRSVNPDDFLCPDFMSVDRFRQYATMMEATIFFANYFQREVELSGALYKKFKTYNKAPVDNFTAIDAYVDTADTGKDYLCSIVVGKYNRLNYVLDVYYTQEAMEVTEPGTAKFLKDNGAKFCIIESNNGGRGFARKVDDILYNELKHTTCQIQWIFQSKNKQARIFSHSATVNNTFIFPDDWDVRWPKFYEDVTTYLRGGDNEHDDAPDCMTGIIEIDEIMPKMQVYDKFL